MARCRRTRLRTMRWFSILVLPAVLASCSTADLISSKPEVKRAAYGALKGEWNGRGMPVSRFGRERSMHVFEGDRVEQGEKELKISGAFGMAAFVSADGYALTAEHVVPDDDGHYAVLVANGEPSAPVHLHWMTVTLKDGEGTVLSEQRMMQLMAYRESLTAVGVRGFEVVRVRLVKEFPKSDLALIKLPVSVRRWFDVRDEPVEPGEVLFMPGNSATPYAGVSAGRVVDVDLSRRPVAKVHTSAPLASGDSGGPAIDVDGKLAGIISHVRLGRLLPWPKMNHSLVRQIDPRELERLIEEDRKNRSS